MEEVPTRRRRPALSCVQCRRRKIKCDRSNPCAQCMLVKSQCSYRVPVNTPLARGQTQQVDPIVSSSSPLTQTASSTFHARSRTIPLVTDNNEQFAEPDAATVRTENKSRTISAGTEIYLRTDSGRTKTNLRTNYKNNTGQPNPKNAAKPDSHARLPNVQSLERAFGKAPILGEDQVTRQLLLSNSGLSNTQIGSNKIRNTKGNNWGGIAPEFAKIIACYTEVCGSNSVETSSDTEYGGLVSQIRDLLQKCKAIARGVKSARPSRSLYYSPLNLVLPDRELATKAITLYIRSFESTHRILHIPTLWAEYQIYLEHPDSLSTASRHMILLVVALGSSLSDHLDASFRSTVQSWIYAAQAWASGPLEKDRLNIAGIQVSCLTLLARQVFSVGGDLLWLSMGSLVHRAMQIGLHRDPSHLPPVSILQAELRRRLWATILEMVVQASLDSAMPPRMNLDEFDTEPPSNINDDELDESTTMNISYPDSTFTTTSIQLVLLNSLPIRLRTVQLLNSLKSELSYIDVLALSSEIVGACRTLNVWIDENQNSLTILDRNMLDYLVRRFLMPLHMPFATEAQQNPLFRHSLETGLDTALVLVSPQPDEGFSRLMAMGGGMFKGTFRHASTFISLGLLTRTVSQNLDGTLHRITQYRDLLKQDMRSMIELSTKRVRQGETNVKSHMFSSMIMAQVEAIEEGTDIDFKIAQAAKDSLDFCHSLLLQLQALSGPLPATISSDVDFTPASPDSGLLGSELDWNFFLPDESFP